MHVIFVYFVRGTFYTKIKCMWKVKSKSENPQRSVTVRKFHAYERSESPGYKNWVRMKYSGLTVLVDWVDFRGYKFVLVCAWNSSTWFKSVEICCLREILPDKTLNFQKLKSTANVFPIVLRDHSRNTIGNTCTHHKHIHTCAPIYTYTPQHTK